MRTVAFGSMTVAELLSLIATYETALLSIAQNSYCAPCQEAVLVARLALGIGDRKKMPPFVAEHQGYKRTASPDGTVDIQRIDATKTPEWAVSNCHTLARRELNRTKAFADLDRTTRERWEHVIRICELAGAKSHGVLRTALPTEITEG